jgi:hypothetical protein
MLITYILLATVAFVILAFAWSHGSLLDLVIKVFFIVMSVWGLGMVLSNPDLFVIPT